MTDNEIITDDEILRALDFSKMVAINIGSVTLGKSEVVAINGLLNRQMYEIEKLTVELQAMRGAANAYKMHYENARAEIERLKAEAQCADGYADAVEQNAIKKFVERLKVEMEDKKYKYITYTDYSKTVNAVIDACIDATDNLVKELAEGEKK